MNHFFFDKVTLQTLQAKYPKQNVANFKLYLLLTKQFRA